MNDIGMKSSRTGNVMTALDKNLSVTTEFPSVMMKEEHVGVYDYTFPDNPGDGTSRELVSVSHGFSYTPLAIVYVTDVTNDRYAMLRYTVAFSFPSGVQRLIYYTDDTDFKILYTVDDPPALDVTGRRFIFKYFIWIQQGM